MPREGKRPDLPPTPPRPHDHLQNADRAFAYRCVCGHLKGKNQSDESGNHPRESAHGTPCCFLQNASWSRPQFLQSRQHYIAYQKSRSLQCSPSLFKENRSRSTSFPIATYMDMGPDLYEAAGNDPQRESSSAARLRGLVPQPASSVSTHTTSNKVDSPLSTSKAPSITSMNERDISWKSHPTARICKGHEICYSSQYTRPAKDLLRELLEVRYPERQDCDGEEQQPLLGTAYLGCRWWVRLLQHWR